MAKLHIVMGCRIGGLRLVGGDSGANPGARYISRSLERFFITGEHNDQPRYQNPMVLTR